jgi:hypothetical protein
MSLLAAAALSFILTQAHEPPREPYRLLLESTRSARSCLDREQVRAGVAARLGYDPFDDSAARTLRVRLSKTSLQTIAVIELRDAAGALAAVRRIDTTTSDCADIRAPLELSIAIAVDPFAGLSRTAETPGPSEPVVGIEAELEAPAPAPSRPDIKLQGSFSALGLAGTAPVATGAAMLEVAARREVVSLSLGVRMDLPAQQSLAAAPVRMSLRLASATGCLHYERIAGCLTFVAGEYSAIPSDLVDARPAFAFYAATGARAQWTLFARDRFSLGARGELLTPLTRMTLRVSGEPVWETPLLNGSVGLTAGVELL